MKNSAFLLSFFAALTLFSCNKSDCYDREMEKNHSGICTQDCPGVEGCDGEKYCNECIANSQGISVAK